MSQQPGNPARQPGPSGTRPPGPQPGPAGQQSARPPRQNNPQSPGGRPPQGQRPPAPPPNGARPPQGQRPPGQALAQRPPQGQAQGPGGPPRRPPGAPPGSMPPQGPRPPGPPPRGQRPPGPPPRPRPPGPPPGARPPEFELLEPIKPSFWQRTQYLLRWLAIAGLIGAGVYGFKYFELAAYIDQKALRELIAPLGQLAPLAFIGASAVLMLLMVIPYAFVAGLGVLIFGLAWGVLWAVLGGTVGAICVWGLSRLLGKRVLAQKQNDARWKNLNDRLRQDGFYYLLLVRASSIVPYNLLNFACAFTEIRLRDFILANLLGLIPSAFVYGFGTELLLDPNTPRGVLIGFFSLVALVMVTPLVFRQARKGRREAQRRRLTEAFRNPD